MSMLWRLYWVTCDFSHKIRNPSAFFTFKVRSMFGIPAVWLSWTHQQRRQWLLDNNYLDAYIWVHPEQNPNRVQDCPVILTPRPPMLPPPEYFEYVYWPPWWKYPPKGWPSGSNTVSNSSSSHETYQANSAQMSKKRRLKGMDHNNWDFGKKPQRNHWRIQWRKPSTKTHKPHKGKRRKRPWRPWDVPEQWIKSLTKGEWPRDEDPEDPEDPGSCGASCAV